MKKMRKMILVITPEMESMLEELRGQYELMYGREPSDHKLITDALRKAAHESSLCGQTPIYF